MEEQHGAVLVLGTNFFKYYKLDSGQLVTKISQLSKKDSLNYSTNYTCHVWVAGYLLVGTDAGEILLCDSNAEFKFMLVDSPLHSFKI